MSGADVTVVERDRPRAVPFGRIVAAIALAWVVPGLGHVFLGQVRRGLVFGAVVFGAFGLGIAHDGRLAMRTTEQPLLTSLQVVANLGVGPADAIARAAVYGAPVYSIDSRFPAPSEVPRLDTLRRRMTSSQANYGTAYLWAAGMMNLLLLFDVWDVGRGRA